MENSTEALLIASGVLITVIIISIFSFSYNNATILPKERSIENDINKLAKWNAEWEAYDKKLMYGSEVITVVNKANQENQANQENKVIDIKVFQNDGKTGIDYDKIDKNDVYECCGKEYSELTGRIIMMSFKIHKE